MTGSDRLGAVDTDTGDLKIEFSFSFAPVIIPLLRATRLHQ